MGDIDDTSKNHLKSHTPPFEHSEENSAWKCRHASGPGVRNLIVCIDGTANQFGRKNTNVIELYHLIRKEVGSNQLTWYNSGIGTYARPSWKSLEYYRQVIDHGIDLAIAWNFGRAILGAYKWLSDNYQEGDRIFLFGFSRGAYQVRVLAAMINKVGLIHKGNEEQIPFAYALYADRKSGDAPNGLSMAENFKMTFSHEKADVHYVGVWDTVSSIGFARGKCMLPGTVDGMKHVCYFRHALALDERRVKFAPEYAYGGSTTGPPEPEVSPPNEKFQPYQTQRNPNPDAPPQTLEVWFPGTHSDIGGGNFLNETMDRNRPPLRWMVFESGAAGLRTKPFKRVLSPNEQIELKESLTPLWWFLEFLPLNRLTYTRKNGGKSTTYKPHMGKARKIHDGQKIHGSFELTNKGQDEYTPKALPPEGHPNFWKVCRDEGLGDWKAVDLFEGTQDLVKRFLEQHDESVWGLLGHTATTVYGRQAVYEGTVGALRITSTTSKPDMPTKIRLISRIMEILDHPQLNVRPLKKSDSESVIGAFSDLRESEDASNIAIAKKFLSMLITFKPHLELIAGSNWPILNVAVSPDSARIVAGLLDYSVRSWDISTEPQAPKMTRFDEHHSVVNVVMVSRDGGFVVSGSQDGKICLWKTNSAALPLGGFRHSNSVRSLTISPDGALVASGSVDNTVQIWDVSSGGQVGKSLTGHGGAVCAVGFSEDGKQIVSCSIDKTVRFWNVETQDSAAKDLALGLDEHWLLSVVLSSDGTLLAAGFSDHSVHIWDLKERAVMGKPFRLHKAGVHAVAFSPDGRKVISGSGDGTVLVWDAKTQELENHFQHANKVGAVVFCPDGKSVVTGCDDGVIRRWNTVPW